VGLTADLTAFQQMALFSWKQLGIYPISDLLLQMIKYSERWERHVTYQNSGYAFLSNIKNLLPEISQRVLPTALPSTENKRMREIMKYIDVNISEGHSLESVSSRFGLSERSLSRLFQSTLGISFLQYLKLLRMVKAFEMMLESRYSMSEIAYFVGYQSISAFSNAFYQFTNFRPSDFKYRQAH
jgi:transcriptional regulator GlxA family with amidase domain